MKLTDATAKTLPGPPDGRSSVIHYDEDFPGYGLRVTKAGVRSFILNYRVNGDEHRMTIGRLRESVRDDGITERQARARAREGKDEIRVNKRNPVGEDRAQRQAPTMAVLAARYLEEWAEVKKRPSSQEADKRMLDRIILPALRSKRVADIQYEDVEALHRKATKAQGPFMANRVVSLLSKMFSLAIKWKMRTDNPVKGIERNPEPSRERYLTVDEMSRLSTALAGHWNQASANAVRLLLLTGARSGEVLGATWDQFDLDAGIWTKPSAHTKQKRPHRVPLSAPARQLLAGMYAAAAAAAKKQKKEPSRFLFPSKVEGKAQGDLKNFWATIRKAANISDVRPHDLRHTYGSVLGSAGLPGPIIGQLLGHTNPSTTARYVHLFDDPLRKATNRVGAIVTAASTGTMGKVIGLQRTTRRG